jgi:multiple antibiotic resistance protein
MTGFLTNFILTFIPLFIVVDAPGNLPIIITLTEGASYRERNRIIHLAIATAAIVGLIFLFLGEAILYVMNISIGAFSISGGIILLVLSIKYMITGRMIHMIKEEMIAVVPIGTPLVVGPATMTTLLILTQQYPLYMVVFSLLLNLLITWLLFLLSGRITRFISIGGLRAISKVFSLILAAIAVSMIINGINLTNILTIPN